MAAVLAEAEARRLPEQFQWWWLVARFLFPVVLRWRRRRPIIRGRAGRLRRLALGHQRQFGSRISGDSTPPFRRSSFRLGRCCGRCRRRGLRWRWNRHPNGRIAPLLKRLTNGGDLVVAVLEPEDRKSTRRTPVTNAHLVCRLLLEKKKTTKNRQ